MNRLYYVVMQLIFLPLAARSWVSWDIAVATSGQIDFFNSSGSILSTLPKSFAEFQALEFDPVNQQFFISDDTAMSNYSIFSLSLREKQDLTPVIRRTNITATDNQQVRDIAYDIVSNSLYWTGETAIYWYSNTMKNNEGEILHKFNEKDIPHGIAIGICKRYLYWTNKYHVHPTIERSLLDGTEREVIISKDLFQPMGIAVDELAEKIYWSDDKEGIYYNIKRANLDGTNHETIIHSRLHEPLYLAIGLHDVYWSDLEHNAIWKINKEPVERAQPTKLYQFKDGRMPQGIAVWSDGKFFSSLECQAGETTISFERHDFMSDGPSGTVVSESSVKEVSSLENEKYVDASLCYNYCLNDGNCEMKDGLPHCSCQRGMKGTRCEENVCNNYCLNGGVCELNGSIGKPTCKCKDHFIGDRCEEMSDMERLCRLYCKQFGQIYVPVEQGVCRCPLEGSGGQYELLSPENSSSPNSNYVMSAGLSNTCAFEHSITFWISVALGCICTVLVVATALLLKKVIMLRKRPRIKKRIIVNKNVTPLTSRPGQPSEQCEITIENCCNMNICETPCFEPQLRTPKSSRIEEKKTLLGSMEETPTSSLCQDELY